MFIKLHPKRLVAKAKVEFDLAILKWHDKLKNTPLSIAACMRPNIFEDYSLQSGSKLIRVNPDRKGLTKFVFKKGLKLTSCPVIVIMRHES